MTTKLRPFRHARPFAEDHLSRLPWPQWFRARKMLEFVQWRDVLALGLTAPAAPASTSRAAWAQTKYPERPIRLIIPFTLGR
jgi:hypothetical protein